MEDRNEFVDVGFDRLVTQTQKAFLVEVDGDETWVPKSQVDNAEELEEELKLPDHHKEGLDTITVPKWLALREGWVDDYD